MEAFGDGEKSEFVSFLLRKRCVVGFLSSLGPSKPLESSSTNTKLNHGSAVFTIRMAAISATNTTRMPIMSPAMYTSTSGIKSAASM